MCSHAVSPLKLEAPLSPLSTPAEQGSPYHQEEVQTTFFQHHHSSIRRRSSLINHSMFFPERAFALLPSDIGRLLLAPLHHLLQNSQGSMEPSGGLDFIAYLPVEISVKILLYLPPQDLCNASSVCSRWYQLTQHSYLYKKRMDYLQHRREEYKKSKENYHPLYPPTGTPQVRQTSASSPLSPHNSSFHGSIRPLSPPPPAAGPSPLRHRSQPTSPTVLEPSPRSSTPSPTFLVDRVSRLSLNDADLAIPVRQSLLSKLPPYIPEGLHPASPMSRHALKEGGRKLSKKKHRLRRL